MRRKAAHRTVRRMPPSRRAAEAQSVKLVFASDKTLTGANGDTVKEIFKSRLDALGYKDYTLTVADDGSTITVEFPGLRAGLPSRRLSRAAGGLFRVRRGRQGMADERGSQAGHEHQGRKDGTGCVVLTLTTRGRQSLKEATAAIADRDSDKKLYIKMDGQTIASPTISSKIDSSSVNIENNFTEQVAENYALLLNAGALPVTLTVSSAPAGKRHAA